MDGVSGKSAARIAAAMGRMGWSRATIERIRAVHDSPEEDIKEKLNDQVITPYRAYRMVRERRALRQLADLPADTPVITDVPASARRWKP